MGEKRHILYFLIAISILMVTVPLIPHHHHTSGVICLETHIDDTQCACEHHHHHHHENDDPCCTSDCIASFESSVPTEQINKVPSQDLHTITLFTEPLLRLLTLPEAKGVLQDYVYIEHLHGACITCAAGLRAPPHILS